MSLHHICEAPPKSSKNPVVVGALVGRFPNFNQFRIGVAFSIFPISRVSQSVGGVLYSSLHVVLTAFGASLVDKAGRKLLFLISVSGILLGNLLTEISFILKEHHLALDISPTLALVGVMTSFISDISYQRKGNCWKPGDSGELV
ncbi:hypothetical protein Ddye_015384 [Dipteronia dyeriana]|uniref:Major facilitator superfamily (MFS) profile domain-containing protein n=1 Tax=Dipteronia dyeriana TaxID=168575 RepID=A0AAD9WZH3_9ROSI|nr:hypothetical protein Ddye_015384 [Dipteronia dyeriana]